MVAFIIFGLIFALPPMILVILADVKLNQKKKEENRCINEARDVKTNYEFNAFDFVENEKVRLKNEHEKRLKKITKKYRYNILLGKMSPDDLDEYMREQSYYRQKVRLLNEGLIGFYKNK